MSLVPNGRCRECGCLPPGHFSACPNIGKTFAGLEGGEHIGGTLGDMANGLAALCTKSREELESENARLRAERDTARKSALWLTELHTQAATEANERGATIERLRSQLGALREALQLFVDPRRSQGIGAMRHALRTASAALASTEPGGEEQEKR